MKHSVLTIIAVISIFLASAQRRPATTDSARVKAALTSILTPPRSGPKPYKDVITDKAVSKSGLFTVHKVEEHYYFEIPDSVLGKEILAVTRFSKTPGGSGIYGGELANQQTIQWDRGPNNNLFLRVITIISVADSGNQIYQAVRNSYVNPIVAAFEIKAFGKDSASVVIDVTDFFRGDNLVVSIPTQTKSRLKLGGISQDRSYINYIHTYPINTEVSTVKTFNAGGGPPNLFGGSLPSADQAGAVTLEMHSSFIRLPATPMNKRLSDPRVGFFTDDYILYSDQQQKTEDESFIVRWRLEPRPEDMEKYNRGELVQPAKPIVYYIDPATPKQWRPYLIAGINDWNKAFEKAGFKNAISAKEWPEQDSTMNLEDARFSVLRYFASEVTNAYGPNIHDPRSGEILESHIGWYHNVLKLFHDWYMIQCGAIDPKARSMKLDDSLMGKMIRVFVTHEVGHTLGLRHNMGGSSSIPVEKLRDKAWVELHGNTASIMDYARFNYVAQPEDHISETGLFPQLGDYDRWAIRWGYKYNGIADAEADHKINTQWILDSLLKNPRLRFAGEDQSADPRSQTEDLGDDAIKAGAYGIKNLQRIILQLPEWTKETGDNYKNLSQMYAQLTLQFSRYMNHAAKNIGGIEETYKSVEQSGDVYTATPKLRQKEAVAFLNRQLFETPEWLLSKNILNKITAPSVVERVQRIQQAVLDGLLSSYTLSRVEAGVNRFGIANTYSLTELIADLHAGIWRELFSKKPITVYRRDLQKIYVEALTDLLKPQEFSGITIFINSPAVTSTDIPSVARYELMRLQKEIQDAIPLTADLMSRIHLTDLLSRIKTGLDPRKGQ